MTLPFERTNALLNTRYFLWALIDPKQTPKVPLNVRRWARSCIKHYPSEHDIEKIAKKLPKLFGEWEDAK